MLEKWNSRTSAGDVLYRDQLLGEIKTNMVNVINDYRGLGVENEEALITQPHTLFTGDIIPSRDDWEILNKVLLELSTVKEQGQMYDHFIQDVSDSLGISDLEKIKEFIDYIQTLPPVSATINVKMELPGFYEVTNLKDATSNNWGHADITWDLSNANPGKPKATISFNPSKSEDVSSYAIRITAGSYSQTIVRPGTDLSPYVLELDWLNWFSSSQLEEAKLTVDMDITDKRDNMTTVSQSAVYPANSTIPQGVKNYEVEYKLDNNTWRRVGSPTVKSFRYSMSRQSGNYSWRVRALDKSGQYTGWATTSPRWIYFAPPPPQPPGRPEPTVTTTITSATVQWPTVARADSYSIRYTSDAGSIDYEHLGTSRAKTFTGLTPNTNYTFYVRATSSVGSTTGSVVGRTDAKIEEPKPQPPGTPSPQVTTTVSQATITWKAVSNADYYEIWHGDEEWGRKNTGKNGNTYFSTVRAGQTLRVTHGKMNQGTTRTWYVRAVNNYGSRIGSATATQKIGPPGKPSPTVTTTVHEATISWNQVSGAEYYEVWHGGETWAKNNNGNNGNRFWSKVNAGSTLRVTHHKMNEGQNYTWNVRAVNESGSNVGSTTATQKKNTVKTKTYRPTGTNVWRGGYHRIAKNWSKTWHGAQWRYSNSSRHNDVYQGAWHDEDWGYWAPRSGGNYHAYGGQKWGNNASYIYFDYGKIRNDLKGKNIQSVTITLTRSSSVHGWATGKPLYLYNHNKTTSQASGDGNIGMYRRNRSKVTNTNQEVTQNIKFARGQTEVIVNQNTKELWQNIVNGHMKGLGMVYYYGKGSSTGFNAHPPVAPHNYMYFDGNIKVDVKYKDV